MSARRRKGLRQLWDEVKEKGIPSIAGVVLTLVASLVIDNIIQPTGSKIGYWALFYLGIYGATFGALLAELPDNARFFFMLGSVSVVTNIVLFMLFIGVTA